MVEKSTSKEEVAKRGTPTRPPDQYLSHLAELSKTIANLTKITEKAVKIRKESENLVEVEEDEIRRVVKSLQRVHDGLRQTPSGDAISRILTNTEEIKAKLEAAQPQKAATWSQIAAHGGMASPAVTAQVHRQQAAEKRKDRELIVTITNQEEKAETGKRPAEAILQAVRAREPKKATDNIVTLRTLPSGDYQLTTVTEDDKQSLERSNDWLQAVATSACIVRTTFTIRAHGVRIQGVDPSKQEEALATIREANKRLHPDLDIIRVAWPKRALQGQKRYGSLIIEMGSIKAANKVITQGLVHEGEVKYCDRFIRDARITQCLRCSKYGHIARRCKHQAACGRCAGNHTVRECTKGETARKCALCNGNHQAWAISCQYRQREVERANLALRTTPALFESSTHPPQVGEVRKTFQLDGDESDSWQIVGKARKGRPTHLTMAARAANQTMIGLKRRRIHTPDVLLDWTTPNQECNEQEEMETDSTESQLPATQ